LQLSVIAVGATSGIGESTLKQFYRQTNKPRVYFVGRYSSRHLAPRIYADSSSRTDLGIELRNEEAANRIISELKSFQPEGELTFIKKDLTLLQSVDEICEELKAKEKKINVLFMSQGTMSLKGRDGD
jgi:NADP-dependent 3-hydroxy acid dehydrogenase YdfG